MKSSDVANKIKESNLPYFRINEEHKELSWFPREVPDTSDRIKLDHIDSLEFKDGFLSLKSAKGTWFGMHEYIFHLTLHDIVRMK